MNTKGLIAAVLFFFITLQAFQCNNRPVYNCGIYKQDTVLLNSNIPNSKLTYRIGDTIWIESAITDNFTPLSGATPFTKELNQLFLSAQPFSIKKITALPELQYANIEFNPVIVDGQLQNNGYGGYGFLYKRTTGVNNLKIGFVAGRTGLYAIECTNSQYNYSGGGFNIYVPNDNCTTYWGVTNFAASVQNKNYWDSLGVTTVAVAPNYGSISISKNMRNYILFKVVP